MVHQALSEDKQLIQLLHRATSISVITFWKEILGQNGLGFCIACDDDDDGFGIRVHNSIIV